MSEKYTASIDFRPNKPIAVVAHDSLWRVWDGAYLYTLLGISCFEPSVRYAYFRVNMARF